MGREDAEVISGALNLTHCLDKNINNYNQVLFRYAFFMNNEHQNKHIKTALLESNLSKVTNMKLDTVILLMEKSPYREDDNQSVS
jgi:hypothetical protein